MGTTIVNIHVYGGDERQIRELLPETLVGNWSENFISVYPSELEIDFGVKMSKALSRKVSQPILHTWLYDSDAVGFAIYQSGRTIAQHFMSPDEIYNRMGNIPLFCETLDLSADDTKRMRRIWKKGNAEEQVWLTGLILGVPLNHDYYYPPEKMCVRDVEAADKWLAERLEPKKITSETKAVLLQELVDFRFEALNGSGQYCSATPLEVGWNTYDYDELIFWKVNKDGTISPGYTVTEFLDFFPTASKERFIGLDDGFVKFDSANLLPIGYQIGNSHYHRFLPDGGFLRESSGLVRYASDGAEMWKKNRGRMTDYMMTINNEMIFVSTSRNINLLERVDGMTGELIEKREFNIGSIPNPQHKINHNGMVWLAHDHRSENGEYGYALTKLDTNLQIVGQLSLPTFVQRIFHSPDGAYIYVFFYQSQVMVVNAETLTIAHTLIDKSFLAPHGFDASGRFWIQRGNSTIEAWDEILSKTLSRHKLKGMISGSHKDDQGNICVATNAEKNHLFRVYKFE